MLLRLTLTISLGTTLLCASAHAAVPHTVAPGESLWSIAAASNLTTRTVAAFNGLSEDAHVAAGTTIQVPSAEEGAAALSAAGISAQATPPEAAATAEPQSAQAPGPMGAYTVRPGDTLSGLAEIAGVPAEHIAAMNGLDPAGVLAAGTVIKLPTGSPEPPAAATPAPAETLVPEAAPHATQDHVDAGRIGEIAAAHGVSPSLAVAIAWQESGFDNAVVSPANARGVMQVMPGTWDYVQQNLAGAPLDPGSASDNVRAGVLYLRQLLDDTGGDETTATAAYYQGLGAVRSRGLFEDTRRYVENVQALRSRFGG
jgi:N-acetylmuramoyl-L-alanine amidase